MKARNRTTGSEILGTLEVLKGRACQEGDRYRRKPDGELEYESNGYKSVFWFWDDQQTVMQDGKPIYLDEDGNGVTADEIELYD